MLVPKKTKYRKAFKGRIHGVTSRGDGLCFGAFGLKALSPERITQRQIEAARRAITRYMKRMGRVWIRIFPDVPVTSKPAEVRMGQEICQPRFVWPAAQRHLTVAVASEPSVRDGSCYRVDESVTGTRVEVQRHR